MEELEGKNRHTFSVELYWQKKGIYLCADRIATREREEQEFS